MRRRGFTLLEMVTVVAIVAICASIAVFGMTRNREAITVERASALLRARLERAQSLAAVAGSRMGTQRLELDPGSCFLGPGAYLWVQINPAGTAIIPAAVQYDAGRDVMTVTCETWNIGPETNNLGRFEFPAGVTTFAFTVDGRVLVPGQATGTVFISLRQINSARRFGFRVLPSGIVCAASDAVVLRCDEDLT